MFSFAEGITEEQSRALIEANQDRFDVLPEDAGYRLAASFDVNATLAVPPEVTQDEPVLRAVLLERHVSRVLPAYLAGTFGKSPEKTAALLSLAGVDLTGAELIRALHGAADSAPLATLIDAVAPLAVLFADAAFDERALNFAASHADRFDGAGFAVPDLETVRDIERYRTALIDLRRRGGNPDDLNRSIAAFSSGVRFDNADQEALARALGVEIGLSRTLQIEIDLPAAALGAFAKLASCVGLAGWLGVGGETLSLIVSRDFDQLANASDALRAAMRAKYADEAAWREVVEPFEDRIREQRRDALSDYIIDAFEPFASRDDLYAYFLIDVSLQGCARTSWVVAANSSLQLYVNRVLANLEQDRRDLSDSQRVHVDPDQIPQAEWAWRKNYRLWEANRKVFLYPETYIEPDLRDNKTALFEELEQSLLQQEINEQTVLDAYATYLRGFEEIAGLEITGAYHQKDEANESDILHVFGATQKDPPTFYYRAIRNLFHAYKRPTRGIDWSHWRKVDLQASSRYLSPVGFNGRLYAFWHELATRPRTKIQGGESKFEGYYHKAKIWYTMAKLDGSWTAPQSLAIGDSHPFRAWSEGTLTARMLGPQSRRPQYSKHSHFEPHDGYSLGGWQWDKLYPTNRGDQIRLGGFNTQLNAPVDLFRNRTTGWIWPWGKAGDIDTTLTPYEKLLCSLKSSDGRRVLYYGVADDIYMNHHTHATLGFEDVRLAGLVDGTTETQLKENYYKVLYQGAIGILADGTDFVAVNGSFEDAFLQHDGDVLLLQGSVREDRGYALHRIGTTVAEDLARTLFERGVDGLLDIETQARLGEAPSPVTVLGDRIASFVRANQLDFEGSLGVYFREIFFHIPVLIANT